MLESQIATDLHYLSANAYFGSSVSLSHDGNILAVGAPGEGSKYIDIKGYPYLDASATNTGAVYIFTRDENSWGWRLWGQRARLTASNAEAGDKFGQYVSLSSDGYTLAVAASSEASDSKIINGDQANNNAIGSGAVYIFTRINYDWSQEAYIKASKNSPNYLFGRALSISSDGNILVVTAPSDSSDEKGISKTEDNFLAFASGAAYLFIRNNTSWEEKALIKASNTDYGDLFGLSVSISADGKNIAVGAPAEQSSATGINGDQGNNLGVSTGAVYLY